VTEEARKVGRGIGRMSGRTAAWLAWSTCALSLALTALTVLLIVLLLRSDTPIYYYWLETSMVAVGYSTVGAIVASRLSDSPIGWLFCAIGLIFGVSHFSAEYAAYDLLAPSRSLPAGEAFAWLTSWVWVGGLGLIVFLDLLFPNGRLPSARWRWFARFTAIVLLPAAILTAFSPGRILSSTLQNPLGIEGLPNASKAVEAFMYALVVVGASSMLARLRHAGRIERQQIKWFAYATAVAISGVILKNTVYPAVGVTWVWWVGLVLTTVGVVSSPVAMGLAIFRYRLYQIDIIINRTLVYGSLTAVLAAVYLGGVVLLQYAFRALTGEGSQLAVVASTLIIAALFIPLRRRIQSFIDRRFYRSKYDAAKTLEAFSARLRDETDLDALSDDLVGVVRETMQPAHVSLWLRPYMPPKGEHAD
jgi:cytochrome b subunit of formate dehydrogenase